VNWCYIRRYRGVGDGEVATCDVYQKEGAGFLTSDRRRKKVVFRPPRPAIRSEPRRYRIDMRASETAVDTDRS